MDALLAAWPVVVREMSRLPALKQLIIESRPIAVEEGVVTLGFPEGRAFLRDAADKRKSAHRGRAGQGDRPDGPRSAAS